MKAPSNLFPIGAIECPDSGALTWKGYFPSLAAAFLGLLPQYWGIVVVNGTGIALAATGHTVQYTGIQGTNA